MAVNKKKPAPKAKTVTKPAPKVAAGKPAPKVQPGSKGPTPSKNGKADQSNVSGFLQFAKRAAGAWKNARKVEPTIGGDYSEKLAPGVYVAQLVAGVLGLKKANMNGQETTFPQVRWGFKITEGDKIGYPVSRFCDLNNEKGWEYLSTDMQRLGCPTADVEVDDLPAAIQELVDAAPTVKLQVKEAKNPEYRNVYINSLVEEGGSGGDEDTSGEPADEPSDDNGGDGAGEGAVELEIGQEVEHPDYGTCKIVDMDENGDDLILTLKNAKGKKISGVKAEELAVAE